MKELIAWDDLRIFHHVAEGGGLSAAARRLGISVPTAGRRMLALEEATGLKLFERSRAGYRLTREGSLFAAKVKAMETAARPLEEWLESRGRTPVVRVSAGTSTAGFLAEQFPALWRPGDPFRIAFVTTEARLDIAHRDIDIGIRNRPAEEGNLASRRLQTLRFAPYRSRALPKDEPLDWVAIGHADARHPAAHWVLAQPDLQITAWANSVPTQRALVRAGAGIGVFPCMDGDRDPALTRAGPLIEELTEVQYLVAHDDDRHRPEVREVIERIAALCAAQAPLLAGERPQP
ncbi:LysR family transcriptional regulator [Pseudoroseicyclus sp. CXY001]|uniref:LysR family transcriptional regulator n=1 Tax=Pseudoroseicyclus sp. CXY001 TaxID=3242492 RepID=UPI003570D883